jgi:hypothetical protein
MIFNVNLNTERRLIGLLNLIISKINYAKSRARGGFEAIK